MIVEDTDSTWLEQLLQESLFRSYLFLLGKLIYWGLLGRQSIYAIIWWLYNPSSFQPVDFKPA